VNGLITVSIAATSALFAEIAVPRYPVLLGIGLAVGCSVRVVGKGLEAYDFSLWRGR